MRREYEMSSKDLAEILDASKPVPYLVIGGRGPTSPQENANRAWQRLADRMGFKWDTVRPNGKGERFFTAEAIAHTQEPTP